MKQKIYAISMLAISLSTSSSTAFCTTYLPGVIIYDDANGYFFPDQKSKIGRKFKRMERVWLKKNSSDKTGEKSYFLAKGTDGKRASRSSGPIPETWLEADKGAFISDLKPWSGCWPFEEIMFIDGVIDVHVTLDHDGVGKISYTEGSQNSPARIYRIGNIIDIRDMNQAASYFFALPGPGNANLSSLDYEVVTERLRTCDAENRTK